MMLPCSFCAEVCAETRRIVQAGHAVERGHAEQPQRSNAPKLYIFAANWVQDSPLTEVIGSGTDFPYTVPKIPGLRPPFFCIQLKNNNNRLLARFLPYVMLE